MIMFYYGYDGYEWRSKDIFRLEIMLLILFVLFTIHEIYQLITIILFVFLPKSLKSKFSEKVIEEKKFSKPKSRLLLLFLGNNFLQLYLSQDLYQMEVEEGEKLVSFDKSNNCSSSPSNPPTYQPIPEINESKSNKQSNKIERGDIELIDFDHNNYTLED